MPSTQKILIIAGPNGAGKTTFAQEFLPNEAHCPDFINADLIAAGLSPFRPEVASVRAGRIMLEEIAGRVERRESFAFETTLAGSGYARMIPAWQRIGYRIELVFLSLPTPEMAIMRVAARVAQGGHSIPEDVIRRRFEAGRRNFQGRYKGLVNSWVLYDNGGEYPVIIEAGELS